MARRIGRVRVELSRFSPQFITAKKFSVGWWYSRDPVKPTPLWAFGNEFGLLCVVAHRNESDAMDEAADLGFLDQQRMSAEDEAEYESQGWEDSFIRLGNASEAFWSEYLWTDKVKLTPRLLAVLRKAEEAGASLLSEVI
jgi:hypothetical protein